jgi:hypothetical protein
MPIGRQINFFSEITTPFSGELLSRWWSCGGHDDPSGFVPGVALIVSV